MERSTVESGGVEQHNVACVERKGCGEMKFVEWDGMGWDEMGGMGWDGLGLEWAGL